VSSYQIIIQNTLVRRWLRFFHRPMEVKRVMLIVLVGVFWLLWLRLLGRP
jgi:hypothetical protein